MSNIAKLNGYDIKDSSARSDIATLKSNKIQTYDTVQDMKNDINLVAGMHVKTKGYHVVGDNGSADYIIKSSSSKYYEELDNGLLAELINDYPINPNQFGAYSDFVHDDSTALQSAISYALSQYSNDYGFRPYIKGGNYFLTNQVIINTPSQFSEWKIELESIKGNYEGYLIDLKGEVSSCNLSIGVISNNLGGCINCVSDVDDNTWMGTTQINCDFLYATAPYDCIHLEADISDLDSWINDNEINVKRFDNGRYGLYAEGCNQLILNHCDFEYGACYLKNCNGALLIAPHLSDPVSATYVLETNGACNNFLIIGGSNAGLSFEDLGSNKYKFSNQTNGAVISYQESKNLQASLFTKSPYCNIVDGKIIRLNPYLYNLNVGEGVFDTRNLTSLECPTYMIASATTTDIILDKAIYGGFGKINEFIVVTNNTSLNIKLAVAGGTPDTLKSFSNSMYKHYKFKWIRDTYWYVEEITAEQVHI